MLQYQLIPVTPFQQNCCLIWCDQTLQAVLVDPGGELEKLIAAVEQQGVNLTAVWLTHGHLDHVGACAQIQKDLHVPIIGPHPDDQFLLDAMAMQCQMFGFAVVEKFLPDQWLDESSTLSLGNEQFSVLHTPGHTPGHIVLQHPAQQLLWVGDVLFNGSIGRSDFPRGNHQQLINSITNKLMTLDDSYRFIPGHGPESTIGEERRNNPFLK